MNETTNTAAQFQDLGIQEQLLEKLNALAITTPTKVQAQTIPALNQGKSLIFQSETGTVKPLPICCPYCRKSMKI